MRYDGIRCETCGWGTTGYEPGVSADHNGVTCHHSANMIRAAESLPKLWWCENWISAKRAEYFLRSREKTVKQFEEEWGSKVYVDERVEP